MKTLLDERRILHGASITMVISRPFTMIQFEETTYDVVATNVIDVDSTSQQRHVPNVSGHIKGLCHLPWSNSRRGPTEMPIVSKKPLIQCCLKSRWASVAEGYPLSKQHLVNVSCFLGRRFAGQCRIRPKTTRLEGGIKVFYVSSY